MLTEEERRLEAQSYLYMFYNHPYSKYGSAKTLLWMDASAKQQLFRYLLNEFLHFLPQK